MSHLICQPALQDAPTVTVNTDSSQYSTLPKKCNPAPDTKTIGYRKQRCVSAASLANLKKVQPSVETALLLLTRSVASFPLLFISSQMMEHRWFY
jgi:hypothetical protein